MASLGWDIDDLLKKNGINREEYNLMREKAVDQYYKSLEKPLTHDADMKTEIIKLPNVTIRPLRDDVMREKPMTKDEIVKEAQSILNKQPFYKTRKIKPVITLGEFIKFRDKMARPS